MMYHGNSFIPFSPYHSPAYMPAQRVIFYVFCRGGCDMKAGGAIQYALLEEYSKLANFEGNVIVLGVLYYIGKVHVNFRFRHNFRQNGYRIESLKDFPCMR